MTVPQPLMEPLRQLHVEGNHRALMGQVLENPASPAAIALVQASRGPQLPDRLQGVAL